MYWYVVSYHLMFNYCFYIQGCAGAGKPRKSREYKNANPVQENLKHLGDLQGVLCMCTLREGNNFQILDQSHQNQNTISA